MTLINDGFGDGFTYEIRKWCEVKTGFTHFADNDVVFAKITPCFQNRKSAVMRDLENGIGAGTTELHVLRPYGISMLSEYLLLLVKTADFIDGGTRAFTGTAGQQRVGKEYVENYPLPVPPLTEQKRIVAKIEELSPFINDYDKAETELSALNETFPQNLRKSLLQYAVEGKLVPQDHNDEPASVLLEKIRAEKAKLVKEGKIKPQKPLPPITEDEKPFDIPDNWVWVRLGEIMNVRGGKRIPLGHNFSAKPTNHIYIRVTDMKNGYITDNNLKYIDDEVFNLIKQYTISKNDLYITIAGTIGEVGEVPPKFDGMNLTENAAKLSILMCNHNFLKLTLLSDLIQTQFIDKTNQVAQPKLALKRIESTLFPLPPLAEQKRIVAKLEQLLPYCGDKLFSFAADK